MLSILIIYFYFIYQSEYYAEILVGKPGQKFTVIFDTTWGDMWLPSKLCSTQFYPICSEFLFKFIVICSEYALQNNYIIIVYFEDTKHLYDSNASSTHKSIDTKPFELEGLVGNLTCDTVKVSYDPLFFMIIPDMYIIPL